MQRLIAGIHQFQTRIVGPNRELFERLARGQSPSALFVTCSDSRISPHLLTQSPPGELFVLRNAGNLVPAYAPSLASGEAATVEFAVAGLRVRDVVVCGHSHCGAVNAILNPESSARLPALSAWLEQATEVARVSAAGSLDLPPEQRLLAAVQVNVLVQLEHLHTHPAVAAAVADGKLRLHGWVYVIESGAVLAHDAESGRFLPLAPAD